MTISTVLALDSSSLIGYIFTEFFFFFFNDPEEFQIVRVFTSIPGIPSSQCEVWRTVPYSRAG